MQATTASLPRQEYQRRLELRRAQQELQTRRYNLLAHARLAVFGVGALLAWLSFGAEVLTAWLLLVPLAGFIALLVLHERAWRARERAEKAVVFYQRGLDRLAGKWPEFGERGTQYLTPEHAC